MTAILLVAVLIITLLCAVLSFRILAGISGRSTDEMKNSLMLLERGIEKTETAVRDEVSRNRGEWTGQAKETREELTNSFKQFGDSILQRMNEIAGMQKNQLETFSSLLDKKMNDFGEYQRQKFSDLSENQLRQAQDINQKLEKMRETVEQKLKQLQDENSKKLEEMRVTVDEKLQNTLDKRLGESFKQVSERLEQVHKGLGEMQTLATGVGDLKKVLSNVKTKGVLGEYQLGNLLEQLLSPEQYDMNVKTKQGSSALVEYAVKMPGREKAGEYVWLPVDAKFPTEDYQALMEAHDQGNIQAIEEKSKALANRIRMSAKDIHDKYIDPPNTTDFAIMFLPFEGLYAEVLRTAGLFEGIQRDYKVVITGPTTLSALLNSLQMGFRTLAIEKRSGEVWELLGAIKTQFSQFGEVLQKTHKKLQEASNVIEQAGSRSRVIERKLKSVQELPYDQSKKLLDQASEDDQPVIEIGSESE